MKNISSLILVFVLLMIWQGAAMGIDAAYILPSPVEILVRLWELREPLFTVHLPATMGVTALGLLISIVLGLILAISMDWNPRLEKALYPVIVASQTIPTTAIAPMHTVNDAVTKPLTKPASPVLPVFTFSHSPKRSI